MATVRPLKLCAHPGCREWALPGRSYCAKHQAEHDAAWEKPLQFIGYPQQLHDLGYPDALIGEASAFLPYDKQAQALGYTQELM